MNTNMRQMIRGLLPPLLLDIYRRCCRQYIWDGVFSSDTDIPAQGDGLDNPIWTNIVRAETAKIIAESKASQRSIVTGEGSLLPLLVSSLSRDRGQVRILDFGGGMGIDYIRIKSSLPDCIGIGYNIVESDIICREGRLLFGKDKSISFYNSLPENEAKMDIVYINSALQYIKNYPILLKQLSAYAPKFFLFVRLSAGNIPTYFSAQKNIQGTSIPYHFINVNELIGEMAELGYSLVFKGSGDVEYDQSNFPEKYRLYRTCNLMFTQNKQ